MVVGLNEPGGESHSVPKFVSLCVCEWVAVFLLSSVFNSFYAYACHLKMINAFELLPHTPLFKPQSMQSKGTPLTEEDRRLRRRREVRGKARNLIN